MSDPRDDKELVKEIRERFSAAKKAWHNIQEEGDKDMRYVAGDPWDPKDRRARENAKRPVLALDELSQYFNQTINDVRANPRAIKFTQKGNGANKQSAEFYSNKTKDIEFQSHAQYAYVTAYENCIHRSYGWTRFQTKYADSHVPDDAMPDPKFFYQDIWIEGVPNPNMVLPDPMWKRPECSDINHLFFSEPWRKEEVIRTFGEDVTITDFSPEFIQKQALDDWIKGDQMLLSEYWKREKDGHRTLLRLKPEAKSDRNPDPQERFLWQTEGMALNSDHVLDSRKIDNFKVASYLTNGAEVLKVTKWPGRYIPFSACTGKAIYVDSGSGVERKLMSMTRLARDPYMLYCYIRTLELEMTGMVTKFPYFYYEGQMTPEQLTRLAKSLHEPIAGIAIKPYLPNMTQQGAPLPFPQRQLLAPDLQAYEIFAEAARRAIQAAMGVSVLPTNAQKKNDKSGVALKQIEKSEQIGSFHFASHFDDMIRHGGIIIEDLMDKIYDTQRETSVMKPDGNSAVITINDPTQKEPVFTKGDHLVTVSSGPAADSQREAVADWMGDLSKDPMVMQRAGDLLVRIMAQTMNLGPLPEELADRLTPPDVKQAQEQEKNGGQPDPKQLMAQLAQSQQQIQQAEQAIATLSLEIKTRKDEFEQQRITKGMELEAKKELELLLADKNNAAKIEIARITSGQNPADLAAAAAEERVSTGLEQAHEAIEAAKDRTHDVNLETLKHEHATAQAQQQHEHAMKQGAQAGAIDAARSTQDHGEALTEGDQGIQGQLAVGQQAADNAPEPGA